MGISSTRLKGLYDGANFSDYDLIYYFKHQLLVKIRCDRKYLNRITFDERWVKAANLVVRKGARLESAFPPLSHGHHSTASSLNPYPGSVGSLFFLI